MTSIASPQQAARTAEIGAGRARVLDRNKDENISKLVKEADRERKEDEQRRIELYEDTGLSGKADRDRAGAEVIDQAQTMLEGVQHLADREEKITTLEQELEVERLEGNADPAQSKKITTDMVTAQAVNQPTVLANERGMETEDRPLNTSGFDNRDVSTDQHMPTEKETPKTRPSAEKIALGKVPDPKLVVHEAFEDDAVKAVDKAPDESLSAPEAETSRED